LNAELPLELNERCRAAERVAFFASGMADIKRQVGRRSSSGRPTLGISVGLVISTSPEGVELAARRTEAKVCVCGSAFR
jgi:hypothetical protein